MANVVAYARLDQTSVTFDTSTGKFSLQMNAVSDTNPVINYGGTLEFHFSDSPKSVNDALMALVISQGALVGLTLSNSNVRLLNSLT